MYRRIPQAARFVYRNRKVFKPYAKAVASRAARMYGPAVGRAGFIGAAVNSATKNYTTRTRVPRGRQQLSSAKAAYMTKNKTMYNRKSKRTLAGRSGTYKGQFKGQKRVVKKSIYETKGHCSQSQKYGTQEQSDCAWIGVTSVIASEIGYDMGIAMIRHIMLKHYGKNYGNINDILNGGKIATIRFYWEQQVSNEEPRTGSDDFDLTSNATTLSEFASWFRDNVFTVKAFNSYADDDVGLDHARYIKGYNIIEKDEFENVSFREESKGFQPLDQMYVKAYSSVTLKIQNITEADASDTGRPLDKNRIDANPVVGKMYKFTTPYPVVNNGVRDGLNAIGYPGNEYILAQDTNEDGVIFPQADMIGAYRTPVPMTHFDKCKSQMKVRLDPGSMKTIKVNFKFDGKLENLMRGLYSSVHTDPKIKDSLGTCIMFAFQKVMRTGANTISLNWQRTANTGCVVKKVIKPVMARRAVLPAEVTEN